MIITSRKNRAEHINEEMLNRIEGTQVSTKSKEYGDLNENDLPAPRELKLKVDAKVMFIKNDSAGRWVNGTVGIVTQCSEKSKKYIRVKVGTEIHKGLTLESCSVDLGSGAFATGQAYVALSRCKTMNTLNLYRELRISDAMVDPDIQDFHLANFK